MCGEYKPLEKWGYSFNEGGRKQKHYNESIIEFYRFLETVNMEYKFVSWNVNGLRAVIKKGFFELLDSFKADFVCIKETKMQ